MSVSEYRSLGALRDRHRQVLGTMLELVEVFSGPSCGANIVPLAELVAYLGTEVLPQVLAEEETVVDAANRVGGLRVRSAILIEGHRHLLEELCTLADAADDEIYERALRYLHTVVEIVTEEERLLASFLEKGRGLDLNALDTAVRERLQPELALGERSGTGDLEMIMLELLPEDLEHLVETREGQTASRAALALWRALHATT